MKNNKVYTHLITLCLLLILVSCTPKIRELNSPKTWILNPEFSSISIITTKNDSIAEVSNFTNFTGQINNDGMLKIIIDLNSLETNIPIRNSRIQEHLFQTDIYKTAEVTAQLKPNDLNIGIHNITFDVDLHGLSVMMNAEFMVFEQYGNKVVVLHKPLIFDAKNFGFENGINTLKNLAKLYSIDFTIPINVILSFEPQ